MSEKLKVIITAGASGIGLETAIAFSESGAEVVICDKNEEALDAAKLHNPKLMCKYCDVSDPVTTKKF